MQTDDGASFTFRRNYLQITVGFSDQLLSITAVDNYEVSFNFTRSVDEPANIPNITIIQIMNELGDSDSECETDDYIVEFPILVHGNLVMTIRHKTMEMFEKIDLIWQHCGLRKYLSEVPYKTQ